MKHLKKYESFLILEGDTHQTVTERKENREGRDSGGNSGMELESVGKQLYQLFKKEGAPTQLESNGKTIGDDEAKVRIEVSTNNIQVGFRMDNWDVQGQDKKMVDKYLPMILSKFTQLDGKSQGTFMNFNLKEDEVNSSGEHKSSDNNE